MDDNASLLSLLKPKDGQPSSSPGPCKCGKRHYLEGIEYDYVFTIMSDKGPLKLGFNANDNPYIAAQEFITKHQLNEHSLDDTPIRNAIADQILKNTEIGSSPSQAEHGVKANGSKDSTNNVNFDPYKSTVAVPKSGVYFNKQTGKFESKIYDPILKVAEEAERNRTTQEAQRRYKKITEEKEKEKNKIQEKIEQDKRERQAAKKPVILPTPVEKKTNY